MRPLFRDRPTPRSSPARSGRRLAVIACWLLIAPGAVPAAELVMRDLQADATVRPTAFDFTLDTPTFTRTGSDSFDAGTGLELGGRYSLSRVGDAFGLVIGLDAATEAYSYDSQDFMVTYGGRGSLGLGYALNDDWTLTGEIGLSYGRTKLSLPATSTAPSFDAHGSYRGGDVRLTCLYTILRRMLISGDVGYLSVTHDLTTNLNDKLTLKQRGLYVGIGMTWRFSNAPERVE